MAHNASLRAAGIAATAPRREVAAQVAALRKTIDNHRATIAMASYSSSPSCSASHCRSRICHAHGCCDYTACCNDGVCCFSTKSNASEKQESPFSSSLQASLQSARRTALELTRVHLAAAHYAHTAHLYQHGGDSSLTSARPHTSHVQPSSPAGEAFGSASDVSAGQVDALHGVPKDLAESIQRHATSTKTYIDHLGSDPSNE